ncbi:MAG TPA: lipopolysaccharide biosynthesis protein [Stellaceae bacterium]|nr:lipopolysaccharide biosynthesis protein [Stellaceae bacterium]
MTRDTATDPQAATPDMAVADSELDALKRRSVRGSAATFAAQGLRFLVKLATQILIARLLVPADYGLVAMVAPVLALSYLMGDLGLGQAVILQRDLRPGEVSALFWFSLLVNIAFAAGLMAVSPAIAWLYHEPRTIEITLVLAGLLPVSGLAAQPIALLNRQMRFTALAVLDVGPPAIGLAAGLAAACAGWGYWSLVAVAVADSLMAVALAWSLSGWRPARPRRHPGAGRLIRVGFHVTGYNLAGYATTSLDNVLLGVFQGSVALGLYDRGYKLVTQPVSQLLMPVGRVATPLLTRLRSDPRRYRQAYLDMLRIMMLAGVPGILFAMVMARPLILLLLGRQWEGVAPVFSWLCLGGLASPLYSSTSWLFTTQGRTRRQLGYVAATSAISVAAFIAGLPWGPVGVAAGAGLSFVLISTPLVCWGATRDGIVGAADLAAALTPLVLAGASSAALLEIVRQSMPVEGIAALAGMAVLSYAAFVAVLLCLPFGQPVIRRAWHFGTMLTQAGRAAT